MPDTYYKIKESTLTAIGDAIRYKLESTDVYDPEVEMPEAIRSISGGGTSVTSIDIVTELPSTLVEGAVYLIPNGGQIFPDLTTVCSDLPDPSPSVSLMHYVVVTCDYTTQDYRNRVTLADLANITKFWLFDGERSRASTRYSIGEDITYGSSSRMTPPSIIYEYDTEHPELGWVDISSEVTQAVWEEGVRPRHTIPAVVFSNFDIFRNTAGTEMWTQRYSICDKYGKAIRIGDVTTYDIYYVDNNVATNLGNHNLKWVNEHFKGLNTVDAITITQNGTYTATGNVDGYSPVTVDVHKMLYKWDFTKSSNPLVDEVHGQTGNLSGATSISTDGYATDGFTRFDPLLLNDNLILDGFKTRFRVKFGEFFSASHSSGEKGRIFSFGTSMSLYWNDVPMLYGSGVGGSYRLTALDNQFDLLEDDELIVDFYKDGNNYKANWIFPDGTEINYGTIDSNSYIILGEYQYTDNGLGGVYVKGLEIELIPIPIT